MKLNAFVVICAASLLAVPASAEKLPKSAKPLTEDEVKALYANRTSRWGSSSAWFAADMTIKGLYGKKLNEAIYWGTWSVKGNEVCMANQAMNVKTRKQDGKTYTDCWQWFRDDKKRLWTLWSTRFDGSKVPKNDYYRGEDKKLIEGDQVTASFDKLKAM